MSTHFTEMPQPAGATGTGAAMKTEGLTEKAVQAIVSGGSVTVEGSMDGTNYTDIGGGAVTGNDWLSIPWAVKWMRLNVTVAIGGSDKLMLGYSTDA